MTYNYRQTVAQICADAGLTKAFARELADAGVSGTTIKVAVDEARVAGATDLEAAVRAHNGVASQLAAPVRGRGRAAGTNGKSRKRGPVGQSLPPADGPAGDYDPNLPGWNHAFQQVNGGQGVA